MATTPQLEQAPYQPSGPPQRQRRGGSGGSPSGGLAIGLVIVVVVIAFAIGGLWASGGLSYGYWWLTNSTPPVVSLAGPTDLVRGPVNVAVQLPPRTQIVGAQVDGKS